MYNPQSQPADSTENVRNGARTINQIVAVGRNRTADKKQQPREVARVEAFNAKRQTSNVLPPWRSAGIALGYPNESTARITQSRWQLGMPAGSRREWRERSLFRPRTV